MASLRNVVKVLLVASLWTQGARAIDLGTNQSSHDVCDTHCTVEDLSEVKTLFETEVTKNEQRTVNLTISDRIYTNNAEPLVCQNLTPAVEVNSSSSYLMWANSEREPYLYWPPNFLSFAEKFSLHFGKKMNIRINCTRKVRKAPLREHNGVSLSDAVTRCLIQDLMPTTGGTLCSLESQNNIEISYKCCQLTNSKITCDVVRSSNYDQWFQILLNLWAFLGFLVLPWYFPALICLFPVYPRFSEEGIRCIVLRDSSPAGFCSFVVKALVPPSKDSWLNKARFFILRAVIIPGVLVTLVLSLSFVLQDDSYTLLWKYCVALWCVDVFNSIISTFSAPAQQGKCKLCKIVFSEKVEHSDIGDQMRVHMFALVHGYVTICCRFTLYYFNLFKSHVYFRLRFQTPVSALQSVFRIFYFVFHLSLGIPLLVVVYALTLYIMIILFSPFYSVVMWEIFFLGKYMEKLNRPGEIRCVIRIYMYFIIYPFFFSALVVTMLFVFLLPMSFMTLIDDADAVFPIGAFLLLILYHICSCFASFSAKYQRLKIKLHQGVETFVARENDESKHSLLLYTKSGAIAIPEDLFEAACQELQMPMMRNFSVALWQMLCLLIFVFSIFASIMTFSVRLGITPLFQIVAIFLAGSFPKIFSLFSSREDDQKLKEIDMEMRLEGVIARYAAQGQFRRHRDGIDGERSNIIATPRNTRTYGSISCTSIPIATND